MATISCDLFDEFNLSDRMHFYLSKNPFNYSLNGVQMKSNFQVRSPILNYSLSTSHIILFTTCMQNYIKKKKI